MKMDETVAKLHLPPEGPITSSLVSYIERFTTIEHILAVCVLGRLEHTCSVLVHVPGTRLVVQHRRLRGLEGMRVAVIEPQEIVFFFPGAHCVFELASRLQRQSLPLRDRARRESGDSSSSPLWFAKVLHIKS